MVGLSESMIRACVQEGLLDVDPGQWPLTFGFQDIKVLRLFKSLFDDGVRPRRARRQLRLLRQRDDRALSSLAIAAHDGHVVVKEKGQVWRADTGQMVFAFQFPDKKGELSSLRLPIGSESTPSEQLSGTADEWFERALLWEEDQPERAVLAYRQVLKEQPQCTEALINLGRLYAESANVEEANLCFLSALKVNPKEPTALYNLGVIAQDVGRDIEAIDFYRQALRLEETLAEAHYNLAAIFERIGDSRSAIRHINEYRKLSRLRRE